MRPLKQAGVTIVGAVGGPLLGLFSLGILCPFANSIVSLFIVVFSSFQKKCKCFKWVTWPAHSITQPAV